MLKHRNKKNYVLVVRRKCVKGLQLILLLLLDQSKFSPGVYPPLSHVIMGSNQQDVARVTNEQRSKWDDSARSYSDVLIRKGVPEPNTREVTAAVQLFTKDKKGARE